jgi:membrane fusion protein (multidrug efflux system)
MVQSGDALYSIERGSFEAAVQRAAGVLAQQEAARDLAQIQLARAQELFERQAGTAVARDQAKAEFDRAIGAVQQAEADLASARIDLGYTEIRAPISGRIGRTAFTDGALVGPDFGVMTIVVKEDPMHVDFPIAVRDFLASGGQGAAERVRVTLTQPNGSTYPHEARIDFADVTVNQSADTVTVRAVVPNPDRGLIDGQLVTVTLAPRNPEMRPVIPQQAMLADREGLYVFTVQDGRAAVRRVRPGQGSGGDVPILEGLAKGDVVIVEGIERVRPGAPVTAQPMQRVGG